MMAREPHLRTISLTTRTGPFRIMQNVFEKHKDCFLQFYNSRIETVIKFYFSAAILILYLKHVMLFFLVAAQLTIAANEHRT